MTSRSNDMSAVKPACARIRTAKRSGTGYLIAPDRVMTCQHVVRDVGVGGRATVTFHVPRPDAASDAPVSDPLLEDLTRHGTVRYANETTDCAVIDLDSPATHTAPLRFTRDVIDGQAWEGFGYPALADASRVRCHGIVADREIQTIDGRPCFQLRCEEFGDGEGAPPHGFSGTAAVLAGTPAVAATPAVIGHVARIIPTDSGGAAYSVAWTIPVRSILAAAKAAAAEHPSAHQSEPLLFIDDESSPPARGTLRFLHLSDLLVSTDESCAWDHLAPGVLDALSRLAEPSRMDGPVDAVFLSGNLTSDGRPESFARVEEILRRIDEHLVNEVGARQVEFFAVPGPRDIDRTRLGRRQFRTLKRDLEAWSDDSDVRDDFFAKSTEDDPNPFDELIKIAYRPFVDWWRRAKLRRAPSRPGKLPADFASRVRRDGLVVDVVGLDSSFAGIAEAGPAVIDAVQFSALVDDIATWNREHHVALLLGHHPPDDFPGGDVRQVFLRDVAAPNRFVAHLVGGGKSDGPNHSTPVGESVHRRVWQTDPLLVAESTNGLALTAGRIDLDGETASIRRWPHTWLDRLNGGRVLAPATTFDLEADEGTSAETIEDVPQLAFDPSSPADQASDTFRNPTEWLEHIVETCGTVDLRGLLSDRASSTLPIEEVYVSLLGSRTDRRPPSAEDGSAGDVSASWSTLEEARGDEDKIAALTPEALEAALRFVGVEATEAASTAAHDAVRRRLAGGETDVRQILTTLDLDQVLGRSPRVLVRGDPGAGKTTTLKRLAVALARARLERPDKLGHVMTDDTGVVPVPIFLSLRHLWLELEKLAPENHDKLGADHVFDWVRSFVERNGGDDWLDAALESGRIAFFFDGLDEVMNTGLRKVAVRVLGAFVDKYSTCRFVVSSRPSGLDDGARRALTRKERLVESTVSPLDAVRRRRFVHAFYGALVQGDSDRAKQDAERLLARLESSEKVADLASTPILLTAIAIIHSTRGKIPDRRAELYEHCVKALAQLWDEARDDAGKRLAGDSTVDEKIDLLGRIAGWMHEHGTEVIETKPLVALVGECVKNAEKEGETARLRRVDDLAERSGLIIPKDGGFGFRHLTFQEFLTARWLFNGCSDREEKVVRNLKEPKFREIAILAPAFVALTLKDEAREFVLDVTKKALDLEAPDDVAERAKVLDVVAAMIRDLRSYGRPRSRGAGS